MAQKGEIIFDQLILAHATEISVIKESGAHDPKRT
jgi:hypothetical protein